MNVGSLSNLFLLTFCQVPGILLASKELSKVGYDDNIVGKNCILTFLVFCLMDHLRNSLIHLALKSRSAVSVEHTIPSIRVSNMAAVSSLSNFLFAVNQ